MNENIAQSLLLLYSHLPLNGKPVSNQYTILSGIVAYIYPSDIIPLTLTTGTKCLGNHAPGYEPGSTLSDSHAEILSRRCLLRYLLLCAIEITYNPFFMDEISCPLIMTHEKKFQLKENWSFWLYISDSPCGDASVYERITPERSFTGKKSRLIDPHSSPTLAPHSLLREKPGRVDIQDTKRTSSMSCSDKICRWSCLGLQG